jgi:hypothetical protein
VRAIQLYNSFYLLHNYALRCTESIRTFERQAELYGKGRTSPGRKVTNSRPGFSLHHYGCALDSCFPGKDPFLEGLPAKERMRLWGEYGRLASAHGFVWGGDWNANGVKDPNDFDNPHIQLTYGHTLDSIRGMYADHGIQGVWAEFDRIRGVRTGSEWGFPHSGSKPPVLGGLPG